MSPVSSRRSSASQRGAGTGQSTSNSGSSLVGAGRSSSCRRTPLRLRPCLIAAKSSGVVPPGIGHVHETGPRSPREQREVLAQRMAFELGREVQCRRLGWPSKTMPVISHVSLRANPRRVHGHDRRGSVSSTSTSVIPDPAWCADVREHLQAPGRSADAEGYLFAGRAEVPPDPLPLRVASSRWRRRTR
jgi:hypothetical protein